uniref:Uncharacterized protein n=1 Tax=Euplotes crassus TaxID=5936 RepID=A0A7S3K9J1_EUPCR|mmetsp:Transcript_16658/g.16341  ORF Transcript_16658/g.16341 Transcript_16658/m.16341 type:complete len:226 (+) Transcript_16658:176-853(+)
MNTEEEKEEFYSLAMPEPYTKKKEFNKKNDDEVHDLTKLKSLYNNDQSLLFLGSSNKGKKATISKNKTLHSKISNVMRNTPLEEIANMKGKRAQSKFSKKQAKTESYKKLITQKSSIDNQQDSFKFGNKKPREGEESVTDYEGIIDALANQGENEDFPKMEELSNISERKKEDAKKSSQPKVGFETQSPPPPGSAVLDITEDLNSSNLIEEGGNRGLKQKNIFGR